MTYGFEITWVTVVIATLMFTDRKLPSANEGADHPSEGSSEVYLWISQGNFN